MQVTGRLTAAFIERTTTAAAAAAVARWNASSIRDEGPSDFHRRQTDVDGALSRMQTVEIDSVVIL
jgi:hypothetical protein